MTYTLVVCVPGLEPELRTFDNPDDLTAALRTVFRAARTDPGCRATRVFVFDRPPLPVVGDPVCRLVLGPDQEVRLNDEEVVAAPDRGHYLLPPSLRGSA